MYQSRGRGISPATKAEGLIQLAWLRDAVGGEALPGPSALGVDATQSPNGDRSAVARGEGNTLVNLTAGPCSDSNQLGEDVLALLLVHGVAPEHTGLDPAGVGAGTYNTVRKRKPTVVPLDASAKPWPDPKREEVFGNLRAQIWWQFREDVRLGEVAFDPRLPFLEELFLELTAPTWELRRGKIYLEDKKALRKRLRRSTDLADAVVMWNWVRVRRRSVSRAGAVVTL